MILLVKHIYKISFVNHINITLSYLRVKYMFYPFCQFVAQVWRRIPGTDENPKYNLHWHETFTTTPNVAGEEEKVMEHVDVAILCNYDNTI